jgi:hypothetical protein
MLQSSFATKTWRRTMNRFCSGPLDYFFHSEVLRPPKSDGIEQVRVALPDRINGSILIVGMISPFQKA